MERRWFLGTCATVGGLTAWRGAAAESRRPPYPNAVHPNPPDDFPLAEIPISELQERMRTGHTTSRRLVDQYIGRIEALNERGPELRHVLEVNPDARSIADHLDAERRAGRVRGPLHGIPILIKDSIATADRMQTTAGSLALVGVRPPRDAFLVRRLRQAGAVILGKTNMSEWSNFRSTRSTSGWSARGGQCRNPYALDFSPSGSSSGSGVAAAVSSCGAAIGTETNGSIILPASVCGVVGIKPTVGLVSRSGIIPISSTQDTGGPMARTVADAAAVLTAIAATDPDDPATLTPDWRTADYTRFLDADGLGGARVGVVRDRITGFSPKADLLFDRALSVMRGLGAEVVDPVHVPSVGRLTLMQDLLLFEFRTEIERYLAEWAPGARVRTLDDLIAFNRAEPRELAYFGQELFEQAATFGSPSDPEYVRVRETLWRQARTKGIDAEMDEHDLDAFVALSTGPARPIDLVTGDPSLVSSSSLAAVAGYPHVTVPMGFVQGLPVGLSFFGRAWSEGELIRLAHSFEQATRYRRPPRFAPTAGA